MNTQTLIESLRALSPEEMDWKFALYSTRKNRGELELDWNLCKFKGIAGWVDTLRTTLLEKAVAEKTVAEYSPLLSDKISIAAIERGDAMIKGQITDILLNIQNGLVSAPEAFVSGTMPKATGFAFYGELKDDEGNVIEQVLFMRRSNPFLSRQKTRLCTSISGEVVVSEKPILKFTPAVDFILIGDVCYFNSSAIEKDFDLENRHFAIAAKHMTLIGEADIVSDYETLEKAVLSARNSRKFANFDEQILDHITRMGVVEREDFLSTYGITIDKSGRMDTSDSEQCGLIIDLLCCRSCLDVLGRLAVANGITPRE